MDFKLFILLIAMFSVQMIDCVCSSQNIPLIKGIQADIPFSLFSGYNVVYNESYSELTTSTLLEGIRSSCSANSIACVGCYLEGQNFVHLTACGNCQEILTTGYGKMVYDTIWVNAADVNFVIMDIKDPTKSIIWALNTLGSSFDACGEYSITSYSTLMKIILTS